MKEVYLSPCLGISAWSLPLVAHLFICSAAASACSLRGLWTCPDPPVECWPAPPEVHKPLSHSSLLAGLHVLPPRPTSPNESAWKRLEGRPNDARSFIPSLEGIWGLTRPSSAQVWPEMPEKYLGTEVQRAGEDTD